jgi:hypothetical protein
MSYHSITVTRAGGVRLQLYWLPTLGVSFISEDGFAKLILECPAGVFMLTSDEYTNTKFFLTVEVW